MNKIIGIGGRKQCGKTTLANIAIDYFDYTKISVADGLKELVCKIYNLDINELYSQQSKESKRIFKWNKDIRNKIEDIENINLDKFTENKEFESVREALQFIGTDILRDVDPYFHVKKFEYKINSLQDRNIICDDLRFNEELEVVKKYSGTDIFIIRPYWLSYSNHQSEISLRIWDFKRHIINDTTIKTFQKKFFEHLKYNKKFNNIQIEKRFKYWNELLSKNQFSIEKSAKEINKDISTVTWHCYRNLIPLLKNKYQYNHSFFNSINKYSSYVAGLLSADGSITKSKYQNTYQLKISSIDKELIELLVNLICPNKPIYSRLNIGGFKKKNGEFSTSHELTIFSPYILEDMKLWGLEPHKTKNGNKVPDIIMGDKSMFGFWLCGLIDGDGSIFINKNGVPTIKVIASINVLEHIKLTYSDIICYIHKEKDIDGLFNLSWYGENAIKLYSQIYKGIGLERKWSYINNLLYNQPNYYNKQLC